MDRLYGEAKLYQSTGGVHTSALSDGHQLLVVASEEIGPTTSSWPSASSTALTWGIAFMPVPIIYTYNDLGYNGF